MELNVLCPASGRIVRLEAGWKGGKESGNYVDRLSFSYWRHLSPISLRATMRIASSKQRWNSRHWSSGRGDPLLPIIDITLRYAA